MARVASGMIKWTRRQPQCKSKGSTPVDKLKELAASCACGVYVTINEYRDYYKTAEEHLADLESCSDDSIVDPIIRAEMINRDTVIAVQFYPGTPIGFVRVYHYDLDAALDEALRLRKLMSWPMVPVWPLAEDRS